MSINTNYNNYSSILLGNTSSANSSNNIYKLISSGYSASKASYGKNTAPALPEKVSQFLTQAKTESSDLKEALNSLLGKNRTNTSSFDQKTATPSDKDAISIRSVDSKKAKVEDVEVDIEQVATKQKNVGDAKKTSEKSFDTSGTQFFELEVGDKKTAISFNVSSGDSNATAQQKMADAINSKKLGVSASVVTDTSDPKNITSKLVLESTKTGIEKAGQNNFSIKDYSGSKAVATFGVAQVDEQAKNAIYKINNGAEITSKSNDVDLGNGVAATLKKATSDAKVSVGKDKLAPINTVREMVNGFNGLFEAAKDNKEDRRTSKLYNELSGIASTYSAGLSRIGISKNKDGYLEIDETKMKKAAESGEIEKFFKSNGSGSSYGFANRLSKTADDVSSKTTEYATTKVATQSQSNPMNSYKYSQLMNTGLLFDSLF